MELIGHRGAAALAPENTLEAIGAGLDAGADGVEVDVRLTADGVAVLLHDLELSRTTDGAGSVSDSSFADVRRFDAGFRWGGNAHPARGRGVVVATLEEALVRVPPDRLLIVEVKGTPWEPGHDPGEPAAVAVARALSDAPPRRSVVSSFNPMALAVVREMSPAVPTAVLTAPAFDLESNLAAAMHGRHAECHVPASNLTPEFVDRAHHEGRRVVAWTVDDPDRLRTLAGWNVDGVICDDPRAAREALR